MGFVGKIAKTTENPAIKYKSLKHSGLYLVFHRFSILFIDLITIHEVLPHDFDKRSPDNMILSVALKYKEQNPIMLTSDNGLQLKSKLLGITTISLKKFLKNNLR